MVFQSQFPMPNNKNGILDDCIETVLLDHEKFQKVSSYKIRYLSDDLDPTVFKSVYRSFISIRDSNIPPTTNELMRSNKSFFQQMLIEPLNLDKSALSQEKASSVPLPSEWCPSQSVFPFHAFEAHLLWHLRPQGLGSTKLHSDILKLRYVEYLTALMKKPKQFLLGILTAYGPNVLDYPIRLLQILKYRQLLRSEKILYGLIRAETFSGNYIDIGIKAGNQKKLKTV